MENRSAWFLYLVLLLLQLGCRLNDNELKGNIGNSSDESQRPKLTISAPSPATGDSSTVFTFYISYTQVETVLLSTDDIEVFTSGSLNCASPSVVGGTTETPQVTFTSCTGSGSLSIKISPGTASNFEILDHGSSQSSPASVSNSSLALGKVVTGATKLSSLGVGHTCALMGDQRVMCWGNNEYLQLGNTTSVDFDPVPKYVDGLSGAIDVVAGDLHSCALLSDKRTIKCWGYGGQYALGTGGSTSYSSAQSVVGLQSKDIVSITGGQRNTCAVYDDGTMQCWGFNNSRQVGDGTTNPASTPVDVINVTTATKAEFGHGHTCALLADTTVTCWGYNSDGQIGRGVIGGGNYDPGPSVIDSSDLTLSGVIEISSGRYSTCALKSNGTVWCWGKNASGQLGNASLVDSAKAVQVTGLSNITQISVGQEFACALNSSKEVHCWGENIAGQIGDQNAPLDVSTAHKISWLEDVTYIAANGYNTCALFTDTTVGCWGQQIWGELGYFHTDYAKSTPQLVSAITSGSRVHSSNYHSCAIVSGGSIQCWGLGENGKLGNNSSVDQNSPVSVVGLTAAPTDIRVGWQHSCALLSNSTVECWGSDDYGQMGNAGLSQMTAGTPVTLSGTPTQLESGYNHICALLSNSQIECWGYGGAGRLGDGATSNNMLPNLVTGISNAQRIGLGSYHSCAILSDETVRCWGKNDMGQLGNGTITSGESLPVTVTGLGDVAQVAGGFDFTCALLNDGTIQCWGNSDNGVFGMAAVSGVVTTPTVVPGISNIVEIAAGRDYLCARRNDDQLKCWGSNYYGQLGIERVSGLEKDIVNLSSIPNTASVQLGGGYHSCIAKNDGKIYCFGLNQDGLLGLGTTPISYIDRIPD